MSIPGSASPLFIGAAAAEVAGYQIDRSLRFNSADSAYLNRTPSSAGNRRQWTWSGWVKRSKVDGSYMGVFGAGGGSTRDRIQFFNNQKLVVNFNDGNDGGVQVSQVFRDPSAWYHIVVAIDTTQATASNRVKIYVNGSQVTAFDTATYPSQNYETRLNNNIATYIGQSSANDLYFDGYLAEVNFIDGQALDPTDFGEYDSNNVWQPKAYTGTYESFDNSQTWSGNITTTGNSGVWHSSYPATNAFNNNDSNYAHANGDGSASAVVTLSISPAISCNSSVTFLGGVTTNGSGSIAINGGTATAFTTAATVPTASNTATVSFSGDITSIVVSKTSTGAEGLLVYGFEIDGKRLVDSGVSIASNSFYLKFADNSSNAALGTDSSGNGNTWTVNNLSVDKPGVTTTGNISLGNVNRSFYFKGTPGQSMTITTGNNIWDSSDGISWTYRGQSSTSVSLTAAYILLNGKTGITFTNSSSASVKYWDLPLGTGIPNGSGTTTTFNLEAYGAEGIDSLIDTPTNYEADSGNNNGGNYCTLNPLDRQSTNGVLSNGNLDIKQTAAAWAMYRSTMFLSSGKYYWEVNIGNNQYTTIGICASSYSMSESTNAWANHDTDMFGYYLYDGNVYNGGNTISYATGDTSASGSVVGVALDMDNGTLTFYKDGTSLGQATSALAGKSWSPTHWLYSQTNADSYNFGQRPFAFPPGGTGGPSSDHKSVCTTNLPDPTIADGSTAFDTSIWSGNSTQDRKISTAFSPDFVWVKRRNATKNHILIDAIRGDDNYLHSNTNNANQVQANLLGLVSDGYELGDVESVNITGSTYVGWAWDGGSSTVSNTDGSITSNVRANASAGFSIVGYQGTGTAATIGHGLNAAPEFIIVKNRDLNRPWSVFHQSITGMSSGYINLNLANAFTGSYTGVWNGTDPTSSVFSVGTDNESNNSGDDFIAYCWAPVEGFSSFGSYTGNGSSDGPFVFTGFRPRFLLYKRTDAADTVGWILVDSERNSYNVINDYLSPTTASAEGTTDIVDFLSNGFKMRIAGADGNVSGGDYVYACFAEHPFASNARAR